ncbi:MAG: glycosyltransferase [Pirellulaceae bacterium]|nr:glycosyltransferase [Pirellulaceae bacterium]
MMARAPNHPQVSVVLPVFNGARTIARAIRSILNQTLEAIELIVVDDGSTDDTVAVVRRMEDSRLKLRCYEHRGVVDAANAATSIASAPVIARMDADDIAYPDRLERQLDCLDRRGADVVGCQVRILDESLQESVTLARYSNWINKETLASEQIVAFRFVEFPLVNPSIMARREYFELGFRDDGMPEDYDLMLRAASHGMVFTKVAKVLLDWMDNAQRLTRTDRRYSLEAFQRCRRVHLLDGPLRGVAKVDLWGFGQAGKPWLRWLQSEGIQVRLGYDIDQRKVGQKVHGVEVQHAAQLAPADGTPLLIAVGAQGAREAIGPSLVLGDYSPGRDAWFVA